jgi:peptidase E
MGGFDVVFVCGGNTFYLMKYISESGFDAVNLISKQDSVKIIRG